MALTSRFPFDSAVVQATFIINAATRACGTSATVSRKAVAIVNPQASCCTGCLIWVIQWQGTTDSRNWAGNDEHRKLDPHRRHLGGEGPFSSAALADRRRRSGGACPRGGPADVQPQRD